MEHQILLDRISKLKTELAAAKEVEKKLARHPARSNFQNGGVKNNDTINQVNLIRQIIFDSARHSGNITKNSTKEGVSLPFVERTKKSFKRARSKNKLKTTSKAKQVSKRVPPNRLNASDKATLKYFHKLEHSKSSKHSKIVKSKPLSDSVVEKLSKPIFTQPECTIPCEEIVKQLPLYVEDISDAYTNPDLGSDIEEMKQELNRASKYSVKLKQIGENLKENIENGKEIMSVSGSAPTQAEETIQESKKRSEKVLLKIKQKLKQLIVKKYKKRIKASMTVWNEYVRQVKLSIRREENSIKIQAWSRMLLQKHTIYTLKNDIMEKHKMKVSELKSIAWKVLKEIVGTSLLNREESTSYVSNQAISIPGLSHKYVKRLESLIQYLMAVSTNEEKERRLKKLQNIIDKENDVEIKKLQSIISDSEDLVLKWNKCRLENIEKCSNERTRLNRCKNEKVMQENQKYIQQVKEKSVKKQRRLEQKLKHQQYIEEQKQKQRRNEYEEQLKIAEENERNKVLIDEERRRKIQEEKLKSEYSSKRTQIEEEYQHKSRTYTHNFDVKIFEAVESRKQVLYAELKNSMHCKRSENRIKLRNLNTNLRAQENQRIYALRHAERIYGSIIQASNLQDDQVKCLEKTGYFKLLYQKESLEMNIEECISRAAEYDLFEQISHQKIAAECKHLKLSLEAERKEHLKQMAREFEQAAEKLQNEYKSYRGVRK